MNSTQDALHEPYALRPAEIEFFRTHGYVHLRGVLAPELIEHYRGEINRKVEQDSADVLPLEQRDTYGKAFLQIMNLWETSGPAREFVHGRRLARIAAELLERRGVRLYHDQALYKEPGGGITPWHADQQYWPMSDDRSVTAWIPLVEVDRTMGPLAFCPASHRMQAGRELEISDESEGTIERLLSGRGMEEEPFAVGDVSFHLGWTFHRAGANRSPRLREVFTIIYMNQDMRLVEPKNANQVRDWERWCPGVKVGEVMASKLNPVLYSAG